MIESIIGTIVDATAPKFFVKKDGTTQRSVTLHIKAVSNDPYPKEIAVKCVGDLCNWAPFAGRFTIVECAYVNRVFATERNGEKYIGNDMYARSIKIAEQTLRPDVELQHTPPTLLPTALPAPTPVLALPAQNSDKNLQPGINDNAHKSN